METIPAIVCEIALSPSPWKRSPNNGKESCHVYLSSICSCLPQWPYILLVLSSFLRFWCFAVSKTVDLHYFWWLVFLLWCCRSLKSLPLAIKRKKHFISIYCRSPHTLLAIHIPLILYDSSHLLDACELQALCSKRLSVLFASPVNLNTLSV